MPDADYDLTTAEGVAARTAAALAARVPGRYRNAEASHPAVIAWCDRLARHALDGGAAPKSLLITGSTGTGKTWQAYGAIRRLVMAGAFDRWEAVTAPELFARLRPRPGADSEAEYDRLAAVPLLLLDDLGAAKDSEWTEEVTYRIVNHRSAWVLPSVYTTNLDADMLKATLTGRVFSRLLECDRVALKGTDRRRDAS
jgi:DNA replication protein DnaC